VNVKGNDVSDGASEKRGCQAKLNSP